MKRLFINYRTEDTGFAATLLARELRDALADQVFLDHDDIKPGEPWPERLREALQQSHVVLALLGDRWLTASEPGSGRRRIDLAHDWVRQELETVKARGIVVIPLQVEGAALPPAEWLPASLCWLPLDQALPLRRTELRAHVERVVATLVTTYGFTRRPAQRSDAARAEDLLPIYRHHVRERHSQLVRYFGGGQRPTLQEVFVEPGLDASGRAFLSTGSGEWPANSLADGAGAHSRDFERLVAGHLTLRELLEIAANGGLSRGSLRAVAGPGLRHWILRGDPGAGKSTLVRQLCHELAADPTAPIPVYLSIARWAREPGDVFDCAEATLARELGGQERAAGLAALLRERAQVPGAVWLFLDGFDEVSGERVAELRDRIATLANNEACAASIVVTARPYALPEFAAASPRLAPGTFGVATIQPLSESSQRDLLTKWLGADRAAAVFAELQARELLADLCRNPLTLTWLALLLRVPGATPPRSRVDLYDRVVRVYLEDTPAVGGDDKPEKVKAPTDARPILAALALALQEAALDGETWTREQLVDALWQIDETHARGRVVKLWGSPDDFLNQVAARCGLLAEFDGAGEGWRFLHRSVREYLVAEALLKRESREQWLVRATALSDKTFPRWAEPFALLCPRLPDAGAFILVLGDHNSALALRCLPEIDVPFAAAFDVLQHLKDWDGDDLLALVQSALRGDELPAAIEAVLWPVVTKEQSLDMLAYVHFAMSSVGIAVDRTRFFSACGRPIEGAPEIEFVAIPAGSFMMGSPEGEAERLEREGPVHQVSLREFSLARTVVTNADYRRFDAAHEPGKWEGVKPKQLATHPAVTVSWWRAYLFCAWIDARLPSESEWEYACRAGTTSQFSFGETISTEQVNYDGNSRYGDGKRGEWRQRPVSVASLPANAWGLCEMHGNVYEWCADRWHNNYEDAPTDGAAWVVRGARDRVLRGGSWYDDARRCRSAYRVGGHPSDRSAYVGFRPARFTTE